MDLNRKTPIGSRAKISNDPLKKTGRTIRKGALDSYEKTSSLAPEVHRQPDNNLKIAFFTKSHLLANTVKTSTTDVIDVENFEIPEKMIEWCEKENPKYVLIDVDSPTPWSEALDVFTNIITLKSEIKHIVLTQIPKGNIPQQMVKKGAYSIMKKPFSADALLELII